MADGVTPAIQVTGLSLSLEALVDVAESADPWNFVAWLLRTGSTYTGSVGDDDIFGQEGNDVINGGDGDDYIDGKAGDDSFNGGAGFDILSVQESYFWGGFQGANFNAVTGVLIDSWGNSETFTGFESYRGSQFGDTFTGSATDEEFMGLGGRDIINGGGGIDTVRYDRDDRRGGLLGVTVNLTTGVAIDGFGRQDTLSNIENIRASNFNDVLTGNSVANQIRGFDGNDVINGGAGADRLVGGAGNDTYVVETSGDIVDESGADGTDAVQSTIHFSLAASATLLGNVENLTLLGTAAINGAGNALNNGIIGNAAANVLSGLGGNDTLAGRGGIDRMVGGAGNDTYVVETVGDIVDETSADGTDTVQSTIHFSLAASATLLGNVENLTLLGTAAINGAGNALANVMIGNAGNNVLNGLGGSDTLNGGAGQDTFVFTTALGATNVDTISGFSVADDTIQLENAIFTGLSAGALAATAFKNTALGTVDEDDRIIYNSATGALSFDADGAGVGAAVQFASLSVGLGVTNADFFVI